MTIPQPLSHGHYCYRDKECLVHLLLVHSYALYLGVQTGDVYRGLGLRTGEQHHFA